MTVRPARESVAVPVWLWRDLTRRLLRPLEQPIEFCVSLAQDLCEDEVAKYVFQFRSFGVHELKTIIDVWPIHGQTLSFIIKAMNKQCFV